MTKTFATNESNDIYLGTNSNLMIASGIDAVLGACRTSVQARLGEMTLQTGLGVPYFQTVFNGNPNIPQIEAAIISVLQAVEGVEKITNLSVVISQGIMS